MKFEYMFDTENSIIISKLDTENSIIISKLDTENSIIAKHGIL